MPRRLIPALTIILFLISCATAEATPPAAPAAETSIAGSNVPPAETPAPTSAAPTTRTAELTTVENLVELRNSADGTFTAAVAGATIPVGGEVRTGDDGRARLDLLPDGTIVRLAPNSMFTLSALETVDGEPKSKVQLAFGKIWILLNGGSLDVETPSGVASVRGSLLGVSFDPETESLTATCLEGHCALSDEDEEVELETGAAVDSVDGDIADEPRDLTEEELEEWQEEAPESEEFLEEAALEATEAVTEAATEIATEDATEAPTDSATEAPPTEPPATDPPDDDPTEPPATDPPPSEQREFSR